MRDKLSFSGCKWLFLSKGKNGTVGTNAVCGTVETPFRFLSMCCQPSPLPASRVAAGSVYPIPPGFLASLLHLSYIVPFLPLSLVKANP